MVFTTYGYYGFMFQTTYWIFVVYVETVVFFNIRLMFQGQATDIQIQAEEIIKLKKQINSLYVKHTGLSLEKIGKQFCVTYSVQL